MEEVTQDLTDLSGSNYADEWNDDDPQGGIDRAEGQTDELMEKYGLTDDDIEQVTINIDQTPDAIVVPASEDKIKDEDPVVTPDETVTTTIEVTDIDIPVEIKSNHPIQVEIDNDDNWRDVTEI